MKGTTRQFGYEPTEVELQNTFLLNVKKSCRQSSEKKRSKIPCPIRRGSLSRQIYLGEEEKEEKEEKEGSIQRPAADAIFGTSKVICLSENIGANGGRAAQLREEYRVKNTFLYIRFLRHACVRTTCVLSISDFFYNKIKTDHRAFSSYVHIPTAGAAYLFVRVYTYIV